VIINLRGTSGSGKTTVVRNLIKSCEVRPIYGLLGHRQPEAIALQRPHRALYALGPYPAAGCDSILGRLGVKGVITLLEKYRTRGDIIFEGLIDVRHYRRMAKRPSAGNSCSA
jgi:hypothetical protein